MRLPLPTVEIIRRVTDDSFDPHVAVLHLRWTDRGPMTERLWDLPGGVTLHGPPPTRLALHTQRLSGDTYAVRLLWEHVSLHWPQASRGEILSGCLPLLFSAVGLDLWGMLEQSLPRPRLRLRAA